VKICYVYDAVHPWETGGVQRRVWELGRRLATAHDHDVHWYGLHYWDGPPTVERDGMTLHGVMPPRELYVGERRSIREAIEFATRLFPSLLEMDADLIDCQEFPYFPAFPSKVTSLRHGSTLALTWHEVWGEYWYDYLGWKGLAGRSVETLTALLPDVHIAVSEQTRADVAGFGTDAHLLPNGIDVDEVTAVSPTDDGADVAFVGRLIPEKGPELFVTALDQLRRTTPGIRGVIVGEGPQRRRIERAIDRRDLGGNVTVEGHIDDHDDVLALLKAADVYVLPSRREGFGITVLEALAAGTPVVTTAHPRNAAEALIQDGHTGAVCDRRADALADGIRRAMGCSPRACREAAAAYDWDRLAQRADEFYRAAVG